MAQNVEYLDAEGLKTVADDYKARDEKKVDKLEGHGLYPDVDKTKLAGIDEGAQKNNITKVQVNGTDQQIEDGTLTIDVETVIQGDLSEYATDAEVQTKLGEYTKTENLADDPGLTGKFLDKETAGTTYVKEAEFSEKVSGELTDYQKTSAADEKYLDKTTAGSTYATKEEMGNLGTIIGECLSSELEDKKEETGKGDCWVTTDNNHIHYYNGTDFVDLGGNIDLSGYVTTVTAESTYAKATAVTELSGTVSTLQTTISGLGSTYATDTELSEAIQGLEGTYAKQADIPKALSKERIQEIIGATE